MSGVIRFISDPHFGHENMAKRRGFPDAYHHDENIVAQWNTVVSKKDTTIILGDITMEKRDYSILDRLLGYKRVILGNHDMGNHAETLLKYVNSIHGIMKIRHKEYGNIFLTHCPIHPSEFDYRINYNIHGHTHENLVMETYHDNTTLSTRKRPDKRYINVCMEQVNYKPKTLEELLK